MAECVFLHVGAPKTGTTYLQEILWGNRDALKAAGFLLPATRVAHYQAMGDLRRGLWYDPNAPWTWNRLVDRVRAWPGTAIISEEMLGAATVEQAATAVNSLRPARVHIVVGGRDLGRTIPSSWQQAIRARGTGRFTDYLEALRSGRYPQFWEHQTPLPILRRWGEHVPPPQRHLVTVPPTGAAPDVLWKRFAEIVGIPDGVCQTAVTGGNTALGAAETELLRRVNRALGDEYPLRDPYLNVVHRHLLNPVLRARPAGGRIDIPLEEFGWVSVAGKQMAEDVQDYPCRIVGDPLDLLPVAPHAGSPAPDHLEEAVLLGAAVETIIGLLRRAESLDERSAVVTPFQRQVVRLRRRLSSVKALRHLLA